MKKHLGILFAAVLWCLLASTVWAQTLIGEIVDIFGNDLTTIKVEGGHSYADGDRVDLTYMAGMLPMMIGQFEVTQAAGDIFISKPISQNMPPETGMKVEISLVRKAKSSQTSNGGFGGAKKDWGKQNNSNSSLNNALSKKSSPKTLNSEIIGKVEEVSGENIRVAIDPGSSPQIGWHVDLFYVTGAGKELPVGTWKVNSVSGQIVSAGKVKGVGDAKKGLKAVIHSGQNRKETTENILASPPGNEAKAKKTESYISSQKMTKSVQEYVDEGNRYFREKNYKMAIKEIEVAANMGHPDAMRFMGSMYQNGTGVEIDYLKARNWYERAAKKDNPAGNYNLGVMYSKGQGVPKNMNKAFDLFLKSANLGYARGQYNLGIMYKKSIGVELDDFEAFKWFEMAARQNLPEALYALGYSYENGEGVLKNISKAMDYYKKAANLGEKRAVKRLKAN